MMSRMLARRGAWVALAFVAGLGCGGGGGPKDSGVDLGGQAGASGSGGVSGAGPAGAGGGSAGGAGGAAGAPGCASAGQACSTYRPCCAGLICVGGGGGCSMGVSDRNLKRDFEPVDDDQILESLARLPLATWSY